MVAGVVGRRRDNISSAVCWRYEAVVNVGNGIFSGKNSTVSTSRSDIVAGK
jgi:hypothetical protein